MIPQELMVAKIAEAMVARRDPISSSSGAPTR